MIKSLTDPLTKSRPKDNFNQLLRLSTQFYDSISYTECKIFYFIGQYVQSKESFKRFEDVLVFQKTIAKKAKCSTKTVYRLLKKMKGIFFTAKQNRRRMGQFSSNTYIFDEDFKKVIKHFYRLKIFDGIKKKYAYQKYAQAHVKKILHKLQKYDSVYQIYNDFNIKRWILKKRSLSMKMSNGHKDNKGFFYLHKKTKGGFVFIYHELKKYSFSRKDLIAFSKYSEGVIFEALQKWKFWLSFPKTKIRNLGASFQSLIEKSKYSRNIKLERS